jgi:polysaccharide biosynthesis protein PslH
MKIIWVKAGGLVPLDSGGKIRSFHIARELARKHSVTLFTFYQEHPNDEHAQLKQVFDRVEALPLRIGSGRGFEEAVNYLGNLLSPLPHSIAKYSPRSVQHALRSLLSREPYDLILCDFLNAAGVVPWELRVPTVIFTHNVEAMIWKRHTEVASSIVWRSVFKYEYTRMARTERHYLTLADHVLTVSDNDREIFAKDVPPEKITTIPTGVDIDFFQPGPGERPMQMVFTGSMDWMPNEDGILYFCAEILPLIWNRCPDAKLSIVGRSPSAKIKALEQDPRVTVTGRVEDVRPYIAGASVYIVPLRVGSGTRLKIFEAMAMGKAVVSTTIGAEGLPVTPGGDIVLADAPAAFADSVCDLLQHPAKRTQIGAAARQLVEARYSWAAVAEYFSCALNRAHGTSAKGAISSR